MALTSKLFNIARSTATGGLAGGAAVVILMVAQNYGFPLTETQAATIVAGIMWLAVHLTPDSLKDHITGIAKNLDVSTAKVAGQLLAIVPSTEDTFPGTDGAPATNVTNINKG